jgi:uncharacterized protein YaiE (UPF0345 family)
MGKHAHISKEQIFLLSSTAKIPVGIVEAGQYTFPIDFEVRIIA